jgi:hypothetical protein
MKGQGAREQGGESANLELVSMLDGKRIFQSFH